MNDDLKMKIGAAVADMAVEEISTAIMSSPLAEMVTDPTAVAALLKSWNPGAY